MVPRPHFPKNESLRFHTRIGNWWMSVFYYEANTSSDYVVFSSCRDPCRLTTGCTSSTLVTTTSGYHRCWRVRIETSPGEAEKALTAVGRILPRCLPLNGIDENTMGRYMDSGCSPISSNSSGHFKRRVHFDSRRRFHSSREKRNGSERMYVFVASRNITSTITVRRLE